MMLRSFLPVGQGAFYREVFELEDVRRRTIIYDCGSLPDKKIVERQIKHEFDEGEIIDAVFISHFDEDHINGIPFLLNYCKVENLFFPLITTEDKIYLKLKALLSVEKGSFLYRFIDNPIKAINSLGVKDVPILYQIRTVDGENRNNVDTKYIPSGENILKILNLDFVLDSCMGEKIMWELIPFNFRQEQRIKQLEDALRDEFRFSKGNIDTEIENLINNYQKYKKKIKDAYRRVSGSFNTNSMTLFSGAKSREIDQYCTILNSYFYSPFNNKNGCLYMGDYDASDADNWKDLCRAYNDYWDYIGCIQIPHHGSKYNYNNEIAKLNAFNVISAGYANKYRHPHSSVIKDLILNNCFVHIVTEKVGSKLDLIVDI